MSLPEKPEGQDLTEQLRNAIRQYTQTKTLYRLSKDAEVNLTTLKNFMSGSTAMHLTTVERLCQELGLELYQSIPIF